MTVLFSTGATGSPACIGNALDKAGREEEATALYRDEIAVTGSYLRLARRLHGLERDDEAVAWIRQGILAVKKIHPGTAGMLQDLQREIWEKEDNHLAVAGLRAEEFLSLIRPIIHIPCSRRQQRMQAHGTW